MAGIVLNQMILLTRRVQWTRVVGWVLDKFPDGEASLQASVESSSHAWTYHVVIGFDAHGEPKPGTTYCTCKYFLRPLNIGIDDIHTIPLDSRNVRWCRHTLAAAAAAGYDVNKLHHCSTLPIRPVRLDFLPQVKWAFNTNGR